MIGTSVNKKNVSSFSGQTKVDVESLKSCLMAYDLKQQGADILEIRILTELKALFAQVLSRHKFGAYEVDIFIPELNTAVEYDGWYWHRNSYDKDIKKQNKVNEKGVKLLRVRENPLPNVA